jgi:hypothetical protein
VRSKLFPLFVAASAFCFHQSTILQASQPVLIPIQQEDPGHEGGTAGVAARPSPLERRKDAKPSKSLAAPRSGSYSVGSSATLGSAAGSSHNASRPVGQGQAAPASPKSSPSPAAKPSAPTGGHSANTPSAKPASPSSASTSAAGSGRSVTKGSAHDTASADEDPGSEGGSSGIHAKKKAKRAQAAKPDEPKKD